MTEYTALMQAQQILQQARIAQPVHGPHNPAWMKLAHAADYLGKQAQAILDWTQVEA
jgi:hypothetical protein